MKLKVGDVIKPKEPNFIEDVYNVKYRILELDEQNKVAKLEVILDEDKIDDIKDSVRHDIDLTSEHWSPWINYVVKIKIMKEYIEYVFDEEDWEVVRDEDI